jgi:Fur family peroxide stress response transcriptional regulator
MLVFALWREKVISQAVEGIEMTGKAKVIHRAETERKLDRFVANCRRAGLKVTPQRIAVYKVLVESKEHPSAETVWEQVQKILPNVSLDTVNRTLIKLAEVGFAKLVEGSGDVRRYDADLDGHQHFKCIKCKRVFDFHYEPYDDIKVPATLAARFKILTKTVYLEGLCDSCRRKSNA